jgi:integration host factor subunit beta
MSEITYTKKDVVLQFRNRTNLTLYKAEDMVDELFAVLRDMLMKETVEKVRIEIRNFGVFEVKPTQAKPRARNPKTNEIVHVPPRKKTHFKPGKILREYLQTPQDDHEANSGR